jgi:hypothetical protein
MVCPLCKGDKEMVFKMCPEIATQCPRCHGTGDVATCTGPESCHYRLPDGTCGTDENCKHRVEGE